MLIPVKYHKKEYPAHIKPKLDEIAGHLDINKISPTRNFSLHTEYSYGKRKLNSDLLKKFPTLQQTHKAGVPMLWHSKKWASEFAEFIISLCNRNEPTLIEIHPPFTDYSESVDHFLEIYKEFEDSILSHFRSAKILIENRSGTLYKGSKFLISKGQHLRTLCEKIDSENLKLKIALDIPQLFTSYGGPQKLDCKTIEEILNRQFPIQKKVEGIHLWGKKRNANGRIVSHAGDLNTYFEDSNKKEAFLEWISQFLNDDLNRYFVPEVNSSTEDLFSIVADLEKMKINFG